METVEELKEKYIKFRDIEEKEYTRDFPKPQRQRKVFKKPLDPILFAVIKARIDGIIAEMTEVVLRTSRNPIINSCGDFTCSFLSSDCRLLMMTNSLPAHMLAMCPPLYAIVKAFEGDIHPGDCFINNDVYFGNSHVGDLQMFAPIFYEGELVIWASTLCHLIDSGAYVPTNLDPAAKDVYEEGIHFPPMRIVKDNKEIPEMMRLIKANFRYPDEWYGDFLAQVGSLRKGEKEILELYKKYGADAMRQCQDELLDYGDARMTQEIRKLPKGVWYAEAVSEKLAPMAPEGLLLKVKMAIDPDEAVIIFDLTGMPDQLPWGYNLSWATSKIGCIIGSMPAFDPTLPRNDGVYEHFHTILREGAVVGMPKWPGATCCATTNIADEFANIILNLWEQVEVGRGHGGNGEVTTAMCVTSGVDFRRNNEPFGHYYVLACSSGGASRGNDGWGTLTGNSSQGYLRVESIEQVELTVPTIVWELGIQTDGGGAGKWRGGPGFYHRIQPRQNPMICLPQPSGLTCAPQGVVGGKSGSLGNHWLEKHIDPTVKTQLRSTDIFQVEPGENWVALTNGGGGYGDPLERDPELVRDDARNYFISMKAARDEYGVVLNDKAELYDIDYKATEKLRAQLRKEGGAK